MTHARTLAKSNRTEFELGDYIVTAHKYLMPTRFPEDAYVGPCAGRAARSASRPEVLLSRAAAPEPEPGRSKKRGCNRVFGFRVLGPRTGLTLRVPARERGFLELWGLGVLGGEGRN